MADLGWNLADRSHPGTRVSPATGCDSITRENELETPFAARATGFAFRDLGFEFFWRCPMRLYTPRLCLRPFTLADAPRVRELAGDARIAATTATIPHPYPEGAAEQWIATLEPFTGVPLNTVFAITLTGTRTPGRELDRTDTGHLIGCIGICQPKNTQHERAEIGYWIGVPYWKPRIRHRSRPHRAWTLPFPN